jgi:hypothetical protein
VAQGVGPEFKPQHHKKTKYTVLLQGKGNLKTDTQGRKGAMDSEISLIHLQTKYCPAALGSWKRWEGPFLAV